MSEIKGLASFYIDHRNKILLEKETNRSKLINDLLNAYYSLKRGRKITTITDVELLQNELREKLKDIERDMQQLDVIKEHILKDQNSFNNENENIIQ